MNIMLDEAVANLTCVLEAYGMSDNTLLMIVSDNGGESSIAGTSYPLMGTKGSYYNGGVSVTAIIHSQLIPENMRGGSYYGEMHVTDWLPTIMHAATNGAWSGSYSGMELDGHDMFEVIFNNSTSPRTETVFYIDGDEAAYALQVDGMKLIANVAKTPVALPNYIFESDEDPQLSQYMCESPTMMSSIESDIRSYEARESKGSHQVSESYGARESSGELQIMSMSLQRTWIFGVLSVVFIFSMGFVVLGHRMIRKTNSSRLG
jgi:arylsulfatase A-like enzyme